MKYKQFQYFFGCCLVIAYIVLKLTNTIDWSWWWILVPILLFL